jgi:hypothetical protein
LIKKFCLTIPVLSATTPLSVCRQAAEYLDEWTRSWSLTSRSCLRGAIRAATGLRAHGGDWDLILALTGIHPGIAWYFSKPRQPQAAMALAQLLVRLAVGPGRMFGEADKGFGHAGTVTALSRWQISILNQAASEHLFCNLIQYRVIAAVGETMRWLPAGLRVVMDAEAPAWWRWLMPEVQRHEDFPHMCDLLYCPIWVVDDVHQEVIDWTLARFSHAMGRVEATAPIPGMDTLFAHDSGHAWLGELRSRLGRDGLYPQSLAERSCRTSPPPQSGT